MGNFKNLKVWGKVKSLAVDVYRITNNDNAFANDFNFKGQIRNEKTNKQSVQFFYIAKGSTAELITQIIIAHEINYLNKDVADSLLDRCDHISLMLYKLILARETAKP